MGMAVIEAGTGLDRTLELISVKVVKAWKASRLCCVPFQE